MCLLHTLITPDWESLVRCIRREGTPARVHNIELYLDAPIKDAIAREYDLFAGLDSTAPSFGWECEIRLQRFLGYDYVGGSLDNVNWVFNQHKTADTAGLQADGGRAFMDSQRGPITTWEEFERYPWPDPAEWRTTSLEWLQQHLPDDMCIIAGGLAHFAEFLSWLMGYETLCTTLYDDRALVAALRDRLTELFRAALTRVLAFDRVKLVWGSDDMGFKTGTLLSPDDLREFVLPGHALMAQLSHAAGRPYLLHTCGKMEAIMPDFIDTIHLDARHSFEDVIEPVTEAKRRYGDRIALLGGIDVDFLCRADEPQIRQRVRATLDVCQPGGGYVLGTGNSVANYIPVRNYLTMLDEGRRYQT